MEPPSGLLVTRTSTSPRRWIIGSLMVSEQSYRAESIPADAITHWQDDESSLDGDIQTDRVHTGGTSAAVWCLGENTFCKAHAWIEGVELEANNIRFVAEKAPEAPIPEVIHTWIDRDLNRTFLLAKRVNGQTMDKAWPRLSLAQRVQIADHVARCCIALATNTSPRLETVTGCGVTNESWLMETMPESHPTWRPRILGPFSQEALRRDGRLSGIIDWESAALYPRFWVATKPLVGHFFVSHELTKDELDWRDLLVHALGEKGGFRPPPVEGKRGLTSRGGGSRAGVR
ncbi:hypothetical protein C8A05DRAFT_45088 [Staphylotrichum tortipilum]|uniref:Aminoglycoside phosphotransferase domain-containing protein n=1 Tax=Staphylotrichum tortipilum TaxID=2831512 RepID=A0AAN6MIC8_9PEZI|nr:hypothetical protein C8A05DRAFT_45088 [Staphylotrichum longicolle]